MARPSDRRFAPAWAMGALAVVVALAALFVWRWSAPAATDGEVTIDATGGARLGEPLGESDAVQAALSAPVTSQRQEFPYSSTSELGDKTRLRLSARAADGTLVTPTCFEIVTLFSLDANRTFAPPSQVVAASGPVTIVDLSPSIFEVRIVASAAGRSAGEISVDRIRWKDGEVHLSGYLEHAIEVQLDAQSAGRSLIGRVTVDGEARIPHDLELTLRTAGDDLIPGCVAQLDRASNTYRITPIATGRMRLFAAGRNTAPLCVEIPSASDDGDVRLDLELTEGRVAILEARDGDTQAPASGVELRIDVTVESWRRDDAVGTVGRPYLAVTDSTGHLEVRGLPERGRLVVSSSVPARRTSHGLAAFLGTVYLDRELRPDDPRELRVRIEVSSGPPPRCVVWGPRPSLCAARDGELSICAAREVGGGVSVSRHLLGTGGDWLVELEPSERAQLWVECSGRRVSDSVAIAPAAHARIGPVDFPTRALLPVRLVWTGAEPGDRMRIMLLGALVDEQLASLDLDLESGVQTLELARACELGVVLERDGARIQRVIQVDPQLRSDIRIDWPRRDGVEIRFSADEEQLPERMAVVLHPLHEPTAPQLRFELVRGRAAIPCAAPGVYFFRADGLDSSALVCGVAKREVGDAELVLRWRGCDFAADRGDLQLDALEGVDLAAAPLALRRLSVAAGGPAGSDGLRPRRIRLPCDSAWSPVRRSQAETDKKEARE